MTDYINRQAAIDAVMISPQKWDGMYIQDLNCRLRDALNALPSAEVEPVKTGRWIIRDNPGTGWYRVTCSECGEDVTSVVPMIGFFPDAKVIWDYCPYCGAKMDAEEGEVK